MNVIDLRIFCLGIQMLSQELHHIDYRSLQLSPKNGEKWHS